jgi:peptide chain release factor 1
MMDAGIGRHLAELRKKLDETREKLLSPSLYGKAQEIKKIAKEVQRLEKILLLSEKTEKLDEELLENKNILKEESDIEIKALAEKEILSAEKEIPELEKQILLLLSPPDPNDSKNIIVEIRPAAGGEEASLFAAEIFRAYRNYAESNKYKTTILSLVSSQMGGIKEAIFSISGADVYSKMKFESGVHRVQRVPATETSGRIHTSTITVAIMPEAEEVDIQINPADLKFDVFRSSGPGGQSVNTTDSAVRATHIPTGISVASQQEKSQHQNKETAIRILRSKLFKAKLDEELAKQNTLKKSQIGSGDRSEKIRTYNFPQNRVTDHRYNISVFNLPTVMEGNFDLIIPPIIEKENERKLKEIQGQ